MYTVVERNYAGATDLSRQKQQLSLYRLETVCGQSLAMGTEAFEVGLFDPNASQGVMLSRVWTLATLIRSVSWLSLKNAQGRNIYIRPAGEHSLSLIDDLGIESVERLRSEGFAPAVVVETSPGNFQAWLRHGEILPKHLSTFVARLLALRFGGDLGSADWRHYGRLAEFTNRKEKHRRADGTFPYVKLHVATGAIYPGAASFIAEIKRSYDLKQGVLRSAAGSHHSRATSSSLNGIEHFRAKGIYGGDQARVDLAYAVYALARGVSPDEVRIALRSRDLTHKGDRKRQQDYVNRTIRKASERIGNAGNAPV
jgi:hypothetical protein